MKHLPSTALTACRTTGRAIGAVLDTLDPRPDELNVPNGAGPLAGLPIAVKDMIAIAGRSFSCGLPIAPDAPATSTAPVAERLVSAGAELIAITAMTPLAAEPSGANAAHGRPVNPWNPAYICGGSSSGSAVAVAAGLVPVALGSDTGGSIRIPAHCCGVTGWKPTYGVIPVEATMPLAPSLDTIGVLARTAADLRPIAEVFAGRAPARAISRVAVAGDVVATSHPAIAGAVEAFEPTLRGLGCSVGGIALGNLLAAVDPPVITLISGEAARSHCGLLERNDLPALEATLRLRLEKGLSISEMQLTEARARLVAIGAELPSMLFREADAVLLPVMPDPTPLVTACEPLSPSFSPRALWRLSAFTRFVNALGLPAVALPAGFDHDGMPIGVQLVGPKGSDLALIELAERIQGAVDWHARVPTHLAALVGAAAKA